MGGLGYKTGLAATILAVLLAASAASALGGTTHAAVPSAAPAAGVFDASAAVRALEAAAATPNVGPAHWFGPDTSGTVGVSRPVTGRAATASLLNHGGEIMPTTSTYVIFWLPTGQHYSSGTTAASDTAYENTILRYFQDVGGSQLLNVMTQYPGSNGTPASSSVLGGSEVDTTPFPHAGTVADPLSADDLNQEIYNRKTAHGWPSGMSAMYFILLPNGVVDCLDATDCNTNTYCAYHIYGYVKPDIPANDFVWADIPDDFSPTTTLGGCGDSSVSGNESADTTLSAVAHEHTEAITDPRLNAWYTADGDEVADLCAGDMGAANADKTIANNYLGASHTDRFRIQRVWSNAANGCAASYTTTGSHVQSPAPTNGDAVLSVAEGSTLGTPQSSLHYTVSFRNPSDQDDMQDVTATLELPPIVQSNGTGTVHLTFGDLAPHQTAMAMVVAQPTSQLTPGTTLTADTLFDFTDSTGTPQNRIVRTATTSVLVLPATHLDVQAPANVTSGAPITVTVSARDSRDVVVPGYTGTVSFTSSDGNAVLPANYTFTAADAGSHTFTNLFALQTTGAQTVTATDTNAVSITGTASFNVTVDTTPPTIIITRPVDHASYARGASIAASYTCADPSGSGVVSCVGTVVNGAAVDTSTAGQHSFTVVATDKAGNSATTTVSYTVYIAPLVSITTPGDGAYYKKGAAVNSSFACTKAADGADIASCVATVNNGSSFASGSPIDTTSEGSFNFTVTATDTVGNVTTQTVFYNVDGTRPTISVLIPPDGFTFNQGANLNADYHCFDTGGSGVASCVGDVPVGSPVDNSLGTHSFTVTATDNVGNTSQKVVHYTIQTRPTPPVPPPGGGGGGGGGAGGVPPDLHVDLTASSATAPAVGSELLYTIKVSTKNVGSASAVRLNLTLPTGFTVTRMYADRGPGCTGTAPSLVCDVAWISPGVSTTVLIWGTVGQAGEQDATATVTSLVETELAANLGDNTTTLKLPPATQPFTPPPVKPKPPVLKLIGRTPAAAHVGKTAIVKATFSLDKAATLTLSAHPLTFLSGSKLGTAAIGKARTQLAYAAKRGGAVPVLLRISYGALKRGQTYKVTVVATGSDGQTSRLVIPFRR